MSRPFDEARYKGLLKGLEITELTLCQLRTANPTARFDSEFVKQEFLQNLEHIEAFPGGWTLLGHELLNLSGGATPLGAEYPDDGIRFLRVQNIMPNHIDDSDLTYITPQADRELARSRLEVNDVLLTITGVSYGKSAVVTPEFVGSNINQHSVRMTLKEGKIRPFFLSTFLNSYPGKLQSDQNITGVTRPALDYEAIRRFRVPLVSDIVQLAIEETVLRAHAKFLVANSGFAEAEKSLLRNLGLENWQPSATLSHIRRASEVLFAGRLDADYFESKSDEMVAQMATHGECESLESLLEVNRRGKQPEYAESGLPVINSKHVLKNEVRLNADNAFAVTSDEALKIQNGDVLMNGTGVGTIGRAAAYLHDEPALPDNHVTILRPRPGSIDPIYLSVFLNTIAGQWQVEKYLRGSSGQIELYPTDIAQFKICLAQDSVQQEIHSLVIGAFSARRQAHILLEAAKRAVEIAIEQSEEEALQFLSISAEQ